MAEQPSYKSSTLSQAFMLSVVFYMLVLAIVAFGVSFANPNIENVKLVVGWASAFEASIASAYLAVRMANGKGGANGLPEATPKVTPTAPTP